MQFILINKKLEKKIPKLKDGIQITTFDDSEKFLVTNEILEYRTVIDSKSNEILSLINGTNTLEEIVVIYNRNNIAKLDLTTADMLIYGKFAEYGIVEKLGLDLKRRELASYLKLSMTLISKKNLSIIINRLSFLVSIRDFYQVLLLMLAANSILLYINYPIVLDTIVSASFKDLVWLFLSVGVILFFHEFGHAITCKKLGASPGEIGFGFYILSPVMFADVSDIWKLKRKERVIVNLAGIYMEVLIGFILGILYLITMEASILLLISGIMFRLLANLNPFLRYDGYWILSDLLNVPNLRKVSNEKLKALLMFFIGKSKFSFNFKSVFLAIYALISISIIFIMLLYVLLLDPYSLLSFPLDLYTDIKDSLFNGERFEYSKFIIPSIFYFIVGKTLLGILIKKKK